MTLLSQTTLNSRDKVTWLLISRNNLLLKTKNTSLVIYFIKRNLKMQRSIIQIKIYLFQALIKQFKKRSLRSDNWRLIKSNLKWETRWLKIKDSSITPLIKNLIEEYSILKNLTPSFFEKRSYFRPKSKPMNSMTTPIKSILTTSLLKKHLIHQSN